MPLVLQAVLAAFPFAWGAGVLLAIMISGPSIGMMPAVVIPLVLIAALAFSLLPVTTPLVRRNIMVGGTLATWTLMALLA